MENDEYKCTNCNQVWGFIPEDYDSPKDYPTVCPHCTMSIWELIKNTYEMGGIAEVIYWLRARYHI